MKTSALKTISFFFLLSVVITSCMKNSSVAPVASSEDRKEAPLLVSVIDYDVSPETGDLTIAFYESQRVYTVPASSPKFENVLGMISGSKLQHVPIRVSLISQTQINDVSA